MREVKNIGDGEAMLLPNVVLEAPFYSPFARYLMSAQPCDRHITLHFRSWQEVIRADCAAIRRACVDADGKGIGVEIGCCWPS